MIIEEKRKKKNLKKSVKTEEEQKKINPFSIVIFQSCKQEIKKAIKISPAIEKKKGRRARMSKTVKMK